MNKYLNYNKPLFDYFLSGFLGENGAGCDIEIVKIFLSNNGIYKFNIDKSLKAIDFRYNNYNDEFIFSNLINTNKSLKYNFKTHNILENNEILYNDRNIMSYFNNLIFLLGEDNHTTNLVFFIKDEYLFILSINSGLGINKHNKIDGYYSPYICFKIKIGSSTISKTTETKTTETKTTKKRIFKSVNYNTATNKTATNNKEKPKVTVSLEPLKSSQVYKISCMLMFSKLYNELDNFKLSSSYAEEEIITIKNMAKNIGILNVIEKLFGEKYQIIDNINNYIKQGFYTLFIDYIINNLKLDNSTDDFNKILFDKLTEQNRNELFNKNKFQINNCFQINKRLYLKNRLYLINNTVLPSYAKHDSNSKPGFYIYAQENGSCSFYSLYWAILINTLFNHSYEEYNKMIQLFENQIFNQITIFITQIKKYDFNYPFVGTILNKLSNLNILTKNEIDIHDDYLYKKEFKYDYSYSGILSETFINTYDYFNSLNFLLIPPNNNTVKMFNDDISYNTLLPSCAKHNCNTLLPSCAKHNCNTLLSSCAKHNCNTQIFLSLYSCFINYPDIFNINTTTIPYYLDVQSTSVIPQGNVMKTKLEKEFVQKLDNELQTAKKEFDDYTNKISDNLNIHNIQYYYIAKSIVTFCNKYKDVESKNIINFCYFIHKFFLFNKLFNSLLKQKLYNSKLLKVYDNINIFDNIDDYTSKKNRKDLILETLKKIIKRSTDFDKFILQCQNDNDNQYYYYNNNFFNQFFNKIFNNKLTTYLDGYTINFNFPPPSDVNITKLKDMRYPENQLKSITEFLYKYPKYLYYDFNKNYIFNINYFVETNIIEILDDDKYKIKLDKYYRYLFFNAVKKNKTEKEIYYFGKKILLLNNYRLESNTYDFRRNSNSLEKEIELIKELLINETLKGFSHFENLILDIDDITTKISKYDLKIEDFDYINCLDDFKLLFNTDNADVLLKKNTKNIYIFYENYYLLINFSDDNKILNIRINDKYTVIKRNDINYPFKYFIPNACLSLIYEKDNLYNVLCIASKFNSIDCKVLFKKLNISNKYNILNYCIDSSNLLNILFDKDPNQIDKLNYFIKNYGINNLNYIYLKEFKNAGIQEITKNDFNLLCLFNSEYDSKDYNYHYKNDSTDYNYYYNNINTKLKNVIIDTKIIEKTEYINYSLIKLINKDIDEIKDNTIIIEPLDSSSSEKLRYLKLLLTDESDNEPLNKLNFKLSKCNITEHKSNIIKLLTSFINNINCKIETLTNIINKHIIDNKPLLDTMFNPMDISNYTYLLKLRISCNNLLQYVMMDKISDDAIWSKIKTIHNSLEIRTFNFKYSFEYLFEFILGINVLDEQFNRYVEIINHYSSIKYDKTIKITNNENIFNVIIKGGGPGNYTNYPLHHIMMGKGKSSVLTPLLSLYFCLIETKKVYIIVPTHLVNQTNKTFNNIIKIFELEEQIFIKSDKDIKLDYLNGEKYTDSIFLIDEFDTILDPLKSNFNLTNESFKKNINKAILDIIKETIKLIFFNNKEYINNTDEDKIKKDITEIIKKQTINNSDLIASEIFNVLLNIKNNILKYNINWGIHPEKGYAIPYMSKDTPLLNSNFNSIFLTLILTYYYYYINPYRTYDLIFDEKLVSTFIYYTLQIEVENEYNNELSDNPELIENYLNKLNIDYKKKLLYEIIVPKIIESIKISEYQYNLSFIDIINIPDVYKIGYSGTVNIDLPNKLESAHNFTKYNISGDLDEKYNVYYSLLVNPVLMPNNEDYEDNETKLKTDSLVFINNSCYIDDFNNYDAIIDTAGLFRYDSNETIAKLLYEKLKNERPIIYLNNQDDILVWDGNKNQKYDPNNIYIKPFFYYSQKHTVGIDIKQDNYPILNGLCLIDKLNTYTEVAQSVFRLRKLNQGHTIQLYCINKIPINESNTIIHILNKNEENNKNSKIDHLEYQTIKANIRSKRKQTNERFKEKVKYFFDVGDYKKITFDQIIKDIFNKDEIKDKELVTKLKDLVYNINSSSYTTNEETSTQVVAKTSFDETTKIINSNKLNNIYDLDFSKYSHNYNLSNTQIVEKNYIIEKFSENILFNPSLLTSLTQVYDTTSAYFNPLLLVCRINNGKLEIFLSASTDIFLYKNDLIINHFGNIINKEDKSDELIELLKTNRFIIMLLNNDKTKLTKYIDKNEILFNIFLKIDGSKKIINDIDIEYYEAFTQYYNEDTIKLNLSNFFNKESNFRSN